MDVDLLIGKGEGSCWVLRELLRGVPVGWGLGFEVLLWDFFVAGCTWLEGTGEGLRFGGSRGWDGALFEGFREGVGDFEG